MGIQVTNVWHLALYWVQSRLKIHNALFFDKYKSGVKYIDDIIKLMFRLISLK